MGKREVRVDPLGSLGGGAGVLGELCRLVPIMASSTRRLDELSEATGTFVDELDRMRKLIGQSFQRAEELAELADGNTRRLEDSVQSFTDAVGRIETAIGELCTALRESGPHGSSGDTLGPHGA